MDVFDRILAENPLVAHALKRASVSSALNRLVRLDELEIELPGSGRRPSTYRKTMEH
jgi:hypothetical protein